LEALKLAMMMIPPIITPKARGGLINK